MVFIKNVIDLLSNISLNRKLSLNRLSSSAKAIIVIDDGFYQRCNRSVGQTWPKLSLNRLSSSAKAIIEMEAENFVARQNYLSLRLPF